MQVPTDTPWIQRFRNAHSIFFSCPPRTRLSVSLTHTASPHILLPYCSVDSVAEVTHVPSRFETGLHSFGLKRPLLRPSPRHILFVFVFSAFIQRLLAQFHVIYTTLLLQQLQLRLHTDPQRNDTKRNGHRPARHPHYPAHPFPRPLLRDEVRQTPHKDTMRRTLSRQGSALASRKHPSPSQNDEASHNVLRRFLPQVILSVSTLLAIFPCHNISHSRNTHHFPRRRHAPAESRDAGTAHKSRGGRPSWRKRCRIRHCSASIRGIRQR